MSWHCICLSHNSMLIKRVFGEFYEIPNICMLFIVIIEENSETNI